MTEPDILDDTTDDYERLETELVAQDRGSARVSTADIDERSARRLVNDLIEDDVVRPIAEERDHHACDGCGLVVDALAASPAFHAGFQRDLRSRPTHTLPRRTRPSRGTASTLCSL
jgi:hypothetical protein